MIDKQTVDIIFAEAVVEVWKERLLENSVTFQEFQDAMINNINLTKNEDRDK